MPQQSKYSSEQFDSLTSDIIAVLEKHQANRDLSLMTLGNMITSIFNHQVEPSRRQQMAEQFTQILLKSVKSNDENTK
ncbi:DUF1414 domain-containing protein [Alteromonadaceae bacterium BrNp21-10]|nr:DUF1414 domain-containing protein [Alteromonadaceae bacterium BrNp21-10]